MANTAQRSFTAGELAPALYARTDLARYANGLRTCRNFFVHRYGGASNRAGTEYASSTKADGVARPLPFAFSADQSYLLEFTDRALRFYEDGGHVVVTSAGAWADATDYAIAALVSDDGVLYYCTVAHTSDAATNEPGAGSAWQSNWAPLEMDGTSGIYEIPTPYAAADLPQLQIQQNNDVVTVTHRNYETRELKRFGHTQWTLSLAVFGPSIAAPATVSATGGTAITDDTYYAVTAVSEANGDEGLPTIHQFATTGPDDTHPVTVAWDAVPGALTYRVYRSTDGQTFGFLGRAGGVPVRQSNTGWSDTSDSIDTTSLGIWVASGSQARITVLTGGATRPANQSFIVTGRIQVSTTTHIGGAMSGRIRAFYSRDGEARVDAGIIANASLPEGGSSTQTFIGTVVVPDNGYDTLILDLVPEVMGESGDDTFSCGVDESSAPENEVSWRATSTGFVDTNKVPDFGIAPPTNPSVFAAPSDYPAAVSSFQQRRCLAGTNNQPELIRCSRTAVPGSFTTSTPLQDDDAIAFQLSSRELNEVRHMCDIGRLVIFASSGEWIAEGDNSNILKPNAINARRFSAHGAATLPPIIIGSAAIFVQARSTVIRDLTVDTVQGISSAELSVFSSHLFDGYTVVDWAFAQIPHNIVWAVRSDGVLLGLTYLPEQQVLGWHRHDTDGFVENVCVVPEGAEDRVYLVVRRTINGATKRYVERMATRSITALTDPRDLIFMDATLSYDGRNFDPSLTMTLSGGSAWDDTERVTMTRSAAGFGAGNVGDAIVFYDAAGLELFRVVITDYTSTTVVKARPDKSVPADFRAAGVTAWGFAPRVFAGLEHLEGKAVAVVGDAAVVSSPNNPEAYPPLTVAGGSITLPAPAVVVHVGLPYCCDLETLDIDTAQGPSVKPFRMLVSAVTFVVEKARSFFVGGQPPTGTDLLEKMDVVKFRDVDDNYLLTALKTGDFQTTIQNRWNTNGRVFVRQPDPVPTTILAVIPTGSIPPT